jgi:transposase
MSKKTYVVTLTEQEKEALLALIHGGEAKARKLRRAHILLLADEGNTDALIAKALHCGTATVQRTRKRFVEGNLKYALNENKRPGAAPKLTDKDEALVIALAKSTPPTGRANWSMQLLAERLVQLGAVESISDETVRRVLKKTISSRG